MLSFSDECNFCMLVHALNTTQGFSNACISGNDRKPTVLDETGRMRILLLKEIAAWNFHLQNLACEVQREA